MDAIELDDSLILRMGRGDTAALSELYRVTSSAVYGFAMSITRSRMDAEDIMHDAFIRAYQAAPSYEARGKPLAWLLTIVRNLSYNKLGSSKVVEPLDNEDAAMLGFEDADPLERMILEATMAILDSQERQIVILHALAGFKHREIAEMLRLPLGTVLSKYHRSMRKLKAHIGPRETQE